VTVASALELLVVELLMLLELLLKEAAEDDEIILKLVEGEIGVIGLDSSWLVDVESTMLSLEEVAMLMTGVVVYADVYADGDDAEERSVAEEIESISVDETRVGDAWAEEDGCSVDVRLAVTVCTTVTGA